MTESQFALIIALQNTRPGWLAPSHPEYGDYVKASDAWLRGAQELAESLEYTEDNFDRARFMKAIHA